MLKTKIISNDKIFERMLELELSDMCDFIGHDPDNKDDSCDLLLADADVMEKMRGIRAAHTVVFVKRDTDFAPENCIMMRRPFDTEELRCRISALSSDAAFDSSPSGISVRGGKVYYNDEPVEFTSAEYAVFMLLYDNRGKIIKRDEIKQLIKRKENAAETNSGDVYIRFIRKKLDEVYNVRIIKSKRGQGYYID